MARVVGTTDRFDTLPEVDLDLLEHWPDDGTPRQALVFIDGNGFSWTLTGHRPPGSQARRAAADHGSHGPAQDARFRGAECGEVNR